MRLKVPTPQDVAESKGSGVVELGSRVGVPYAECFWQHLGGGFSKDPFLQNELNDFIPASEKIK